ncbi:MAG: hypothetical protein JW849_06435 [Phycisphaerae bacterium]|nr:hypothetical protein [Phycisphaerae bacterium]
MNERLDHFDPLDILGRYARGELSAAQIESLTRRVNDDPELRLAWTEYQISRYIDGELTPEETAELTTRLQGDPELAEALETYQTLNAELAKLADDVPEFDFPAQREEILTAVEHRQARRRQRAQRWILRPTLVTLAAAATFVLALGVYLMVRTEAPPPAEEFRVSILPPAPTPPVTGRVEVTILQSRTDSPPSPAGSVVALAGPTTGESLAQGMSSYMMLACCAGMPPAAATPPTAISPLFQAWACLSWFLERQQADGPPKKFREF